VSGLVDTAPETLDTLNELAAALGDDPNFATTVTNSIAGKVSLTGDQTIAGVKTFSNNSIFNGNVGIGTSSPTTKLHVISANNVVANFIRANTQFAGAITFGNETGVGYIDSDGTRINFIAPTESSTYTFFAGSTERMKIDSAGNVGIGTSSPSVSLDINSTDAFRMPSGTSAQRPSSPTAGMMRYNTDFDTIEWYDANGNIWVQGTGVIATGGTVTEIVDDGIPYRVHSFTSVGTSSFQVLRGGAVEYLIVAGGGGGGTNHGGGGGAGGLLQGSTTTTPQSYSVIVGGGGAGGPVGSPAQQGSDGGISSAIGITATGGGGGGGRNDAANASPGRNGGSGGGGGGAQEIFPTNWNPGSGISGQGNNGGTAVDIYGGGGGGAGGVGQNAVEGTSAGNGGEGISSSISGTSLSYAGGGGGSGATVAGSGGSGIGGSGSIGSGTGTFNGLIPTANRGGGGGGGGGGHDPGGTGASGIVILRYRIG
jgi:hypothetical protein